MATRGFMNFVAFVALIFIGVSLLLSLVVPNGGDVERAFRVIAEVLAYVVVAFYAFIYASRKTRNHRLWFIIAWTAAVVLIIIVFFFLNR